MNVAFFRVDLRIQNVGVFSRNTNYFLSNTRLVHKIAPNSPVDEHTRLCNCVVI